MSLHIFMKIDGVEGDTSDYGHKGWSDVLSWNWGMTSNRKAVAGDAADRTSLNEITIIKPMGIDSPAIRLLFAKGAHIPKVELNITPVVAKRETQTKYVSVKLEDVVIKSIVSGGSAEDKTFKEHISLLFGRVHFEFSHYATAVPGAAANLSDFSFNWDVGGGKELPH